VVGSPRRRLHEEAAGAELPVARSYCVRHAPSEGPQTFISSRTTISTTTPSERRGCSAPFGRGRLGFADFGGPGEGVGSYDENTGEIKGIVTITY
jgi:hypothetical protein